MYSKQDMQKLVQSLNEFETAVGEMTPTELKLLAETAVEAVDAILGSTQSAKDHSNYLGCVLAGASAPLADEYYEQLRFIMKPQWDHSHQE